MAAGLDSILPAFVVILGLLLAACSGQEYEACPLQCSCLGVLVDCSEKDLVRVPEKLPSWVEILDLSSNNIEEIPDGTFQRLHLLKELTLSNNKLSEINSSLLSNLPKLTKLVLDKNGLSEIPLLEWNSNLTHLSLDKNNIENVSHDALSRLPRLRHLNLSNNKIRNLTRGTFPVLPELHQLYLNNVKLETIEAGAFDNVTSLVVLKLNKNKLDNIPDHVFNKLRKLEELHLHRNRIQVLEGLVFKGLDNLVDLKMKKNLIHELKDGCFYGLERIQTLELDNNAITSIKTGWLYGLKSLQHLSLSNNNISSVEAGVWIQTNALTQLNMERNSLTSIRKNNFTGLKSLKHLKLIHNKIAYIEQESFSDLGKLQLLDLSYNQWTIEGLESTFEGLKSLDRLILDHNQIKSISAGAFTGLDSLELLNLNSNAISTIQPGAFQPLQNLQQLIINSTSLLCDCNLAWLPLWIRREAARIAGFDRVINGRCAHPDSLKNKSIFEVMQADFLCNGEPKPVIIEHPKKQIALKGGNATLSCTAGSSSESMMRFHWKKDNIRLLNPHIDTFAKASENDTEIVQWISHLHITDISDADDGEYQCVVSNDLGETFSEQAKVAVHVFPTFEKVPSDVTVKAGSIARLECAAKGQPIPEVAWQKDGGDDFPAARDRRMHVMPTDDVFFITDVKAEDQGVYSCRAKSPAGEIVVNATLKVHNKPTFVRDMQSRIRIMEGKTAVLECFASGSPQPNLTWKKDGEPLEITDRHFFAANRQLLLILQTSPGDSGQYSCQMQNTLGTMRGETLLDVISSGPPPDEGGSDQTTTTGIIIIAVVCCVVGTSLIWVIIIYQTRKKTEEYSSTPTDETTLPGEMPSTPFHCDGSKGSSPGLLAPHLSTSFGRYPQMCNGGFGYSPSPHHMRVGAMFPSDIEDDDQRLSVPLTQDEQQLAEASENSITMLRRPQPSTNSDSGASTGSPRSSTHSTRSTGLLQTFQPHHARGPQHGEGEEPAPTVAIVHPVGGSHQSNPRLAYLMEGRRDGHHTLSDDAETESDADSDYYTVQAEPTCATFPRPHKASPSHNSSYTHTVPHRYHPPHPPEGSTRPLPPPRGTIPHNTGDSPSSITHVSPPRGGSTFGYPAGADPVRSNRIKGHARPASDCSLTHHTCHSNSNHNGDISTSSADYQSEAPPSQTVLPSNGNVIPSAPSGEQTNCVVNMAPLPHRTSQTVECK